MNQKLESIAIVLLGLSLVLNYVSKSFFYIDSALIFLITIFIVYRTKVPFKNLFDYKLPLMLIISYSILLLVNFINETHNYSKNLGMIFHFLLLYCLYYYFVLSSFKNENFDLVLKTLYLSISFLSTVLIVSSLLSIDVIHTIKRLSIVPFSPSAYHSSQTFLTVCIGLILFYLKNNFTLLNKILFSLIIVGTFVVEGKTAIITLSGGIFIYFISYMLISKKLTVLKFFASIVIMSLVFYLMMTIRNEDISNFNMEDFTTGRFSGWLLYIDLILKENTLFGFGIFGGKLLVEQGLLAFKHPHNIFIEALFTTGVIGFTILLGLFASYIKNIYTVKACAEKKAIIITTFFTVLVSSQGFWSIWSKNHVVPIMIIIAISFLLIHKSEKVAR